MTDLILIRKVDGEWPRWATLGVAHGLGLHERDEEIPLMLDELAAASPENVWALGTWKDTG